MAFSMSSNITRLPTMIPCTLADLKARPMGFSAAGFSCWVITPISEILPAQPTAA